MPRSRDRPIPDERPYAGSPYGAFALIGERRGGADPATASTARRWLATCRRASR